MAVIRTLTTKEVIEVWPSGGDFTLTDLLTQTKFTCRGGPPINYDHSDWQYKTKADYDAVMAFAGRAWTGRPAILETASGCVTCVSYHTFNHSIPVASPAYNIVSPNITRATELDSSGNWRPGHHMCMHYIDSINLRGGVKGSGSYTDKMYQAIVEASRLSGSVDLARIQLIDGSYSSSGMMSGPLVQPIDPPVVIREGHFTLKFDYTAAIQFYDKFKVTCYAEKVPFILLPNMYKLGDKKAEDLIGYCCLIINNDTKNAVAAVVGGTSGYGLIESVSVKGGWSLGAVPLRPSQIRTPDFVGNFTIAIFDDFAPEWTTQSELNSQVEAECSRRLAASLLHLNQNSRAMALAGGTMNPAMIDPKLIDKYMITLDRNTSDISFALLSELGVVGAIIEAGYSFSGSGIASTQYENPKINQQVKVCKDAGIDFALYMDVRASTVVQAQTEMRQFATSIRKYPPVLGVWLKVHFVKDQFINNQIVDVYYNELVKLGLVDKVGFYCAKDQLELIDWPRYSDDWYWWMIESVGDTAELDELLTPEFFMYDKEGI